MTSLCTYGGQDIKISDERFEYGRNFANKIWNASRFVLMNLDGVDNNDIDYSKLEHISSETRDKLSKIRPKTLAQASRIGGVKPADISILMVMLERHQVARK